MWLINKKRGEEHGRILTGKSPKKPFSIKINKYQDAEAIRRKLLNLHQTPVIKSEARNIFSGEFAPLNKSRTVTASLADPPYWFERAAPLPHRQRGLVNNTSLLLGRRLHCCDVSEQRRRCTRVWLHRRSRWLTTSWPLTPAADLETFKWRLVLGNNKL